MGDMVFEFLDVGSSERFEIPFDYVAFCDVLKHCGSLYLNSNTSSFVFPEDVALLEYTTFIHSIPVCA
jgi:hypothetical protein